MLTIRYGLAISIRIKLDNTFNKDNNENRIKAEQTRDAIHNWSTNKVDTNLKNTL